VFLHPQDLDNKGFRYAPGERYKPMSLLMDLNAEVLSFPTIYAGKKRLIKSNVSYADIARSEVRRFDRRLERRNNIGLNYWSF